jgi:hypothetical protein
VTLAQPDVLGIKTWNVLDIKNFIGNQYLNKGASMTCIVGLIDNGKVWMGGDSAGVSGLDVTVRKDPKVFKNGDFLIGYTSSFRMGQLLRFKFNPPKYYAEQHNNDEYQYMCTDFIEAIRICLKAGGYSKVLNK